ncbi:hypothetical protein EDB95_1961 [Dinghuibacter silviterrae]|uniref:Uncharacterized protein n=1 Tax=Dinghuibacter silviterrae TaxID=1539049 RepID=A0A4R8DUT7_9BACT|nr:hypothetical protein EDB95_1961 [Dinghuibacter silviterrae]
MNNSITLEIAAAIISFVAPSVYVAYQIIRFNRSLKYPKSSR